MCIPEYLTAKINSGTIIKHYVCDSAYQFQSLARQYVITVEVCIVEELSEQNSSCNVSFKRIYANLANCKSIYFLLVLFLDFLYAYMLQSTRVVNWISAFQPRMNEHNCHLHSPSAITHDDEYAKRYALCPSLRFWNTYRCVEQEEQTRKKRGFFHLPKLDYPIERGVSPLFSPTQLKIHYHRYHRKIVSELNEHTLGTMFEAQPLDVIIRKTNADATLATLFHAATQHFNHAFFWRCITPFGSTMSQSLRNALVLQYGSLDDFQAQFLQHALNIPGSGWVFLVWADYKFELLSLVDPGSSPIAMDYIPLLNLDMSEHSYYIDYEMDPAKYVRNFFRCINWNIVDKNWNRCVK